MGVCTVCFLLKYLQCRFMKTRYFCKLYFQNKRNRTCKLVIGQWILCLNFEPVRWSVPCISRSPSSVKLEKSSYNRFRHLSKCDINIAKRNESIRICKCMQTVSDINYALLVSNFRDEISSWYIGICQRWVAVLYITGPLVTKKTPSYEYVNPRYQPKTVWRFSQVYNGNP